ncbi:hypothetical protein CVT24_003226 [Panaeolus cyanescens]|uniref:Glycosyltransferase family 32 protein n=1 Tax=Panaeolus cyanescens TaxID=181874 RepID=A0A409VFV6_9AGAR|nr:hypothetical protein CVT24_003226 [Panaeolus cyanescens]
MASLPSHSSAIEEKLERHRSTAWTRPISLPIPGVRTRRLRILVPNTASLNNVRLTRLRRKRGPLFVAAACLAVFFTVLLVGKSFGRADWNENGQENNNEPPTLVFGRQDLQRIWKWEISSGHYPSQQSIPIEIGLTEKIANPAAPRQPPVVKPPRYRTPGVNIITEAQGVGAPRVYLDIQSHPPNVAYPPRPVPGSVADMDHIMKHCDFAKGKYVRDCLEMLRMGGGLDNGERLRRDDSRDYRYIYIENPNVTISHTLPLEDEQQQPLYQRPPPSRKQADPNEGLLLKKGEKWEPRLGLPVPLTHRQAQALPNPCDPENPRVYHMFWTGPFTDKPYLALMSFLYTQNTGIHLKEWPSDAQVCRPQFWLWINPGPAASIPNPNAVHDMFEQLKSNPWASPFLHPRFNDVIKFKLWNTTEQLDGIPEIKDEWRELRDRLFNSGGHIISLKEKKEPETTASANATSSAGTKEDDDLLNRTGSKSSSSYDRLSVILSDMARFVLCHRFGGIYLDADTLLLRDWEELWGWKGAFAYRWSRLEKYNTAVLRMNKGSALGSFLFRTALKNGLDFHPMTVSRYTKDAHLEPLLLRLPDALFDAAWLNTENYQRDRPPQPYFTEFADLFDTPKEKSASPHALGLKGFFKGSYSYHFHNFWWKPFDPSRNFPDLGERFKQGEQVAKANLRREKLKALQAARASSTAGVTRDGKAATTTSGVSDLPKDQDVDLGDGVEPDRDDLDWSTVIKRTFEAYIRGERPNMYGEWIEWDFTR